MYFSVVFVCFLVIRGSVDGFVLLRYFSGGVSQPRDLQMSQYFVSVYFIIDPIRGLFVPMLIH